MTTNNIVDCIEAHAMSHPGSLAVVSGVERVTYRELVQGMSGAAALLAQRGAAPGVPVGVCAERSLDWVRAMLAVFCAGGVYVPINPMAPMQQKIGILQGGGIRLLAVDSTGPGVAASSIPALSLDELRLAQGPVPQRAAAIPGQPAYLMCTSGSAGTPKIVAVSYESLWHYAGFLRRELALGAEDRYLQSASIEFSASMRQVLAPLVSGATLVIARRDEIRDPLHLITRMVEDRVTVFDTVPSYLRKWVAVLWEIPAEWREKLAGSLRMVMTTGETLPADTVNSVRRALPGLRVLNLYGQTETTGTVAVHEVETPAADPVPIGRISGYCLGYVLNERQEAAEEGELCIAGPCVAIGYHGAPSAGRAFVRDPFDGAPGSRMYRTGDRVRRIGGGKLQFLGRADRQVKVHGIRMDLGDIEVALRAQPGIQEAAVVLLDESGQDGHLVAFVETSPGTKRISQVELRASLAGSLGDAMTPSRIVVMDAIPRTESGKLDYGTLASEGIPVLPAQGSGAPLSTDTERLIAACWEGILEATGIGPDDDFFALGGDSLQAIEMLLELRKRAGKTLPLAGLFFQDPMLGALAAALDSLAYA